LFLGVSHGPVPRGGASALPNFEDSPLNMTTLFKERITELGVVTHQICDRGMFLAGRPRTPYPDGVAIAVPNFAGSPLLMRTRLDLEPPNSAW